MRCWVRQVHSGAQKPVAGRDGAHLYVGAGRTYEGHPE